MIRHQDFGALRTAIGAATSGVNRVGVFGCDAVREREPILPGGVGGSRGNAHLVRGIIRAVENDGHSHQICAGAAREVSGDRDVMPDDLLWGGGGGGDGRASFYPPCAPLRKVSSGGTVRKSVSAYKRAPVLDSKSGLA